MVKKLGTYLLCVAVAGLAASCSSMSPAREQGCLIGAGLGVLGAVAATRVMSSLLFGVAPTDIVTFGVVSMTLIAVAFVACFIPAWRATRVDPLVALRYE